MACVADNPGPANQDLDAGHQSNLIVLAGRQALLSIPVEILHVADS